MIAALQMYDWPEVHARTDSFWAKAVEHLVADHRDPPRELSRPEDMSAPWRDPDLYLGQTCGLPYVAGRCADAVVIARADYGVEGAREGRYASVLVCRSDAEGEALRDFQGKTAAINEFGSQSGCNALADSVLDVWDGDDPLFGKVVKSGAHRASAAMVADGQADVAAIDPVSWALFTELEPERHARLRVFGWTRSMPSLPFITASTDEGLQADLWHALFHAAEGTPPAPGLPHEILPAKAHDYAPIRMMADRIKGLRLAPDAPAL